MLIYGSDWLILRLKNILNTRTTTNSGLEIRHVPSFHSLNGRNLINL